MLTESSRFTVRFLRPAGRPAAAFVGKGVVEIIGGSLVLTGTKRALFGFGASASVRYALDEVANVERAGKTVRFVAARDAISLKAGSEDEAKTLAARLPATVTTDVVQARHEHTDFAVQLFTATPRAFVGPVLIALNVGVFVLMVASGVPVLDPK